MFALLIACSSQAIQDSTPSASNQITPVFTQLPPTQTASTPLPEKSVALPTPSSEIPKLTPIGPTSVPVRAPLSSPEVLTPSPVSRSPIEVNYGGMLSLASRESFDHFDVHQELSPALSIWGPGIAYSRLLRFENGPDVELPSLAVECDVCERWEMIDSQTFEFELRDNVSWHNIDPVNGRPLTAHDIVFSYERQRSKDWPNAHLLRSIDSVEAITSAKLRVNLNAPDADFMIGLADGRSKIVAPEAVQVHGDLRNGPTVGTGPWILTDSELRGVTTFQRNPNYFEQALPFLDGLSINVIPDAATRSAAFRVGNIDVTEMTSNEWSIYSDSNPGAVPKHAPGSADGIELALNTLEPPFDNIALRKALFLAIDPWKTNEEVFDGLAYVSLGMPLVSNNWSLSDDELATTLGDIDAARKLFADASGGEFVPLTISVGDFGKEYEQYAELLSKSISSAGFLPSIDIVNRREFGERVWLGGEYQMFVGPIAPISSPNEYLFPILHSQGNWNTSGYSSATLDTLIEAQAVQFDSATRGETIREIQREVFDAAYRFMPATRVSIWAVNPRVQNFYPNFSGSEYIHWSKVWIR